MVQREVEVKVLEVDAKAMQKKLKTLGAKKIFDDVLSVRVFEPLPNNLDVLRVRKEGKQCFLTVKKLLDQKQAKVTDEFSVRVDDMEMTTELLQLLGFSVKFSYEKHRMSYVLNNVHVEFDTFLGQNSFVPTFMEIEGGTMDQVYQTLALLDVSKEKALPWSGKKILHYYQKNPFKLSSTTKNKM